MPQLSELCMRLGTACDWLHVLTHSGAYINPPPHPTHTCMQYINTRTHASHACTHTHTQRFNHFILKSLCCNPCLPFRKNMRSVPYVPFLSSSSPSLSQSLSVRVQLSPRIPGEPLLVQDVGKEKESASPSLTSTGDSPPLSRHHPQCPPFH